MPRVTQYIRDDDLEAWNALENKSAWIHEHLNHDKHEYSLKDFKSGKVKGDIKKLSGADDRSKGKPTTYKQTNNWGA